MKNNPFVAAFRWKRETEGYFALGADGKFYPFSRLSSIIDAKKPLANCSGSADYLDKVGECVWTVDTPAPVKDQSHVDDVYGSLTEGQRQHMANKLHKHGYVAAKVKHQKTEVVKRLDKMSEAEQRECLGWTSGDEILAIYDELWPSLMPIAIRNWLKDNTLA